MTISLLLNIPNIFHSQFFGGVNSLLVFLAKDWILTIGILVATILVYGAHYIISTRKTRSLEKHLKLKIAALEKRNLKLNEEVNLINQSKRDFVSNMSHEIRTPLNGVIGITDLMLETNLSVEQKNYVKMVKHSADQLLSIINDILDLSKIETGQLELDSVFFNLHEVVEEAGDMLLFFLEKKNISLFIYISNDVPDNLRGDPKRLRQVLVNLISNAYKFTDKGEITIIVQTEKVTSTDVTIRFSISDSGAGIEAHKVQSIFQSFSQADASTTRKFGGSGLGLSISKQLCELMKGKIWVESPAKINFPNGDGKFEPFNEKEGRGPGSTFHFTGNFHIHEESSKNKREVKNPPENLNILCLDLHPINTIVISQMLKKYNYNLKNIIGDLNISDELGRKNFDVILINHQTQNMEINKRVENIRKVNKIPFIILTTLGEEKNLSSLKKIEHVWSITKPIKREHLLNTLINIKDPSNGISLLKSDTVDKDIEILNSLKDKIKILLVEDNHINQRVALSLLGKTGIPVEVADDGAIAVNLLAEKKYDLVLMDIAMPNMDGITATQNIRKVLGLDIPIIALTAQAIGDSDDCFTAGMNDYIAKPIQPKILYKTLVKWIIAEQKLKKVINKS